MDEIKKAFEDNEADILLAEKIDDENIQNQLFDFYNN